MAQMREAESSASAVPGTRRGARGAFKPGFKQVQTGLRGRGPRASPRVIMAEPNGTKQTESKPLLAVSAETETEGPSVPISAIVRAGRRRLGRLMLYRA